MTRLATLVVICLSTSFNVKAEDVFDLAEKYNSKKNKVLSLETQKRGILSEIYGVERETNKIVTQKSELDDKKIKLDGKLVRVSKKILKIESNLRELTPDLTERLAFAEQINNLPWFYTFLTSQSVMELDHLFETATKINSSQAERVLEFINLITDLEKQKKVLTETAREIVGLRKVIIKKEKEISSNQVSKKRMLSRLKTALSVEKRKLKNLKGRGERAVANSDFKSLGILFGTDFFDKKGRLPHPIKAPIEESYGLNKVLSSDQVELLHKGYFYRSLKDQKVTAVAAGRIRFAGKVTGFGKVVVLDHGSRYYTTYANLRKVTLLQGTEVKAGDLIGKTGHKHLQYNLGLYFEIRHFSQPQNPKAWLSPQDGHLATL